MLHTFFFTIRSIHKYELKIYLEIKDKTSLRNWRDIAPVLLIVLAAKQWARAAKWWELRIGQESNFIVAQEKEWRVPHTSLALKPRLLPRLR